MGRTGADPLHARNAAEARQQLSAGHGGAIRLPDELHPPNRPRVWPHEGTPGCAALITITAPN